MPRPSKALRAESARLRGLGWSYRRIAAELRLRHRVNARVAYRLAHGWTQEEVAHQWNERWSGAGSVVKTGKAISYWEVWPGRGGREPSARTLARLAELYHCRPGDLLDGMDCGDLETMPGRAPAAETSGRGVSRYRHEAGGAFSDCRDGAAGDGAAGGGAGGGGEVPGARPERRRESFGGCDGPDQDVDWVRAPAVMMVHQSGPEDAGWGSQAA
ncbi:hypothetical protein Ga0074812_102393 [Parafrankia irregularis]|uniref:HTH cro/C1-type domain-containing protein n=1 Tax=Parafrankia irregularis TaxID=795642 RepID=A0A0S4QGQ9_9ACTN|nr:MULTISPECIES: helix-turn-helix transcriptional regulator [Parafrankia]MBE3202984.1 helix-turn-helix transcriptional regulator [Parafrankia sp. CH37]CUU54383.1 hypothetical protein Ga0074812_102393 [Parafrankia irregularis]